MSSFLEIDPFQWDSIGVALFAGFAIGLERQVRGKPVGIRTSSLIVLGTYFFITTALQLQGPQVDGSRVIGQVITGIGFLGAGVMLAKDGAVVGVTSAATIWVLASLGVLIGYGFLEQAFKLTFLIFAILYGVDILEDRVKALTRGVHKRFSKTKSDKSIEE